MKIPPFLRDRDSLILIASVLGLVLILWLMALPLSLMPEPIGPAAELFAEGALVTIQLTILSGSFGLILGVVVALGKRAPILAIRWLADIYVWIIRGTPLLLQILFFYFAMPEAIKLNEFWTAVLALSLNVAAYNAEVIRAGINAVPPGQIEAARSLGLSRLYTLWDIVLPQAARISLPPLANNLVALLKDSSLAYVISVVELTLVGSRIQASSFQPVPVFITSGIIYLVLTTTITQFAAALERKASAGQRQSNA